RHEEEGDERHREPGLADVTAERDVVRPTRLEEQHDDEDRRDRRRGAEPEVGALLREQLHHLPLVDARHAAASSSRDSVSPRKSSSSVAVCGTSAVISMPARPSATLATPIAASSQATTSSRSRISTPATPG